MKKLLFDIITLVTGMFITFSYLLTWATFGEEQGDRALYVYIGIALGCVFLYNLQQKSEEEKNKLKQNKQDSIILAKLIYETNYLNFNNIKSITLYDIPDYANITLKNGFQFQVELYHLSWVKKHEDLVDLDNYLNNFEPIENMKYIDYSNKIFHIYIEKTTPKTKRRKND
jgi:hypothetical protein